MCARARAACECACVCVTVVCARVCLGAVLAGDLINGNERTELKRNWSIGKPTGINNPLDGICGFSGGGGGAEENTLRPPIFFAVRRLHP